MRDKEGNGVAGPGTETEVCGNVDGDADGDCRG